MCLLPKQFGKNRLKHILVMCLLPKKSANEKNTSLELSFASRLRLFLTLYARLLIMLALFDFRQYAVFCNRAFKAAKSSINSLIFANFSFRHQFPLPPTRPSKSITRLINFHYRRKLNPVSMLIKKVIRIYSRICLFLPRLLEKPPAAGDVWSFFAWLLVRSRNSR